MTTLQTEAQLSALDGPLVWAGFRQMVPVAAFVAVFGAAFGVAAAQTGLHPLTSLLMSALVFAGAAQFAALEQWGAVVPVLPLASTVFAINARHLLMGATLHPWLRHLPPRRRYGAMVLASDANWAMAMQQFSQGRPGLGLLVGGGFALWVFWLAGTAIGTFLGGAVTEPRRFGLDMVMGCFLLSLAIGGQKNLRLGVIWVVAAAASLAAHRGLPAHTHVVVGAVTGGLLGMLWTESPDDR